ncbi:hypothetical protein [Streptomyces sp. cf386]
MNALTEFLFGCPDITLVAGDGTGVLRPEAPLQSTTALHSFMS